VGELVGVCTNAAADRRAGDLTATKSRTTVYEMEIKQTGVQRKRLQSDARLFR
jgi:hypothetical protein